MNSRYNFENIFRFSKKSQIWSIDLIIAAVIFSIGIFVFFVYSLNAPENPEENIGNLFYEGKIITESLLSEGHPQDWNSANVLKIGIIDNGKINETKLERFYNLAQSDYERTMTLLNTKYDYYFLLNQTMDIGGGVGGIGKSGTDIENINAKNLVKIERFTIYKEKPITAYLYIWEE